MQYMNMCRPKNLTVFLLSCFIVVIALTGCVEPKHSFEKLPAGPWRGVLLLDRNPVVKFGDDRDVAKKFDFDSELPFLFDIVQEDNGKWFAVFRNGEEQIKITDVSFGRATISSKDTVRIDFKAFDTYITAIYEDGVMEGHWHVPYRDNYAIPFKAVFGQNHLFAHDSEKSDIQAGGKWKVTFEPGTPDAYPAVGEFQQNGNKISGTFLTETGDYRYLDGHMLGKKLYMSAFDGAHAFLFVGKMLENGSITGTFRSGKHHTASWEAVKDENASLADPYLLTKAKSSDPIDFTFPNPDGQQISLSDDAYQGKIKLIQIMGTWCPNCMDELQMIQEYLQTEKPEDVAVISLAFERYREKEKALKVLKTYKAKTKMAHEILWGGYYDKKEALKQLPQLDTIMSYPTLLYVDKYNQIRKVYTGFSGPATPAYEKQKSEFKSTINAIRNSE